MTPRPVDIPLARAHSHLAQGRFPQAIGAFRAAVGLDSTRPSAHLGLAEALAAGGRRDEAIEGLVAAAEAFGARDKHAEALHLLGKALTLDPGRTALHLDLAMVEEAMGQHDAAVLRVEALADRCMDEGRTEEAVELLRFLASWGHETQPEPQCVPRHTALITGATVIARNPLLPGLEGVAASEPSSEVEVTVVRAPSAPIVLQAVDPEADMVTQITPLRVVEPPGYRPMPTSPVRSHAPVRSNPVVERLRARAGLGQAGASPRRTRIRATEPIAIRRSLPQGAERRSERDEDVTVRYRRPRELDAAS